MYDTATHQVNWLQPLVCKGGQALVVHAFNPSTRDREAGGWLSVRGQPAATGTPCLKKQTKNKNKKIPTNTECRTYRAD